MSQHDSVAIRKPRTDEQPLWDLIEAALGGYAVLVAHNLKLFALLAEKPCTLQKVCDVLQIARRPAEALLTVGMSAGLLQVQDGRYSLTPTAEDYLLSLEERQLFSALRGDQRDTNRFFGLIAQTTPIPEFFAPENIQRIIGAR